MHPKPRDQKAEHGTAKTTNDLSSTDACIEAQSLSTETHLKVWVYACTHPSHEGQPETTDYRVSTSGPGTQWVRQRLAGGCRAQLVSAYANGRDVTHLHAF